MFWKHVVIIKREFSTQREIFGRSKKTCENMFAVIEIYSTAQGCEENFRYNMPNDLDVKIHHHPVDVYPQHIHNKMTFFSAISSGIKLSKTERIC